MAPNYSLYSGFTVADALQAAGAPPDDAHFQQGEPPVTFFTEVPPGCAAVFSTRYGTTPFRFVENPIIERQGQYWWAARIQLVCDELRRLLPEACRSVEAPQTFWDLYKYFDAYEIYYRGAQNLWNVINNLVFENNYVREVVEKEQRMQTEQHIPLFEILATELMEMPGMRTKLLEWDEEKQPDILQALNMHDLQHTFEAYENYPEHFLEAIRVVFRNHCEALRQHGLLAPSLHTAEDLNIDKAVRLDALRRHLDEPARDSFMDKFEIPNKIDNKIPDKIDNNTDNKIVVVDGTSQTAAHRAGYRPTIRSTEDTKPREVLQGSGAHDLLPALNLPATDVNLSHENGNRADTIAGLSGPKRCSSAPRIGGDAESILCDPFTDKAYASDDHDDDTKFMVFENPISPKTTSSDTQIATNAHQAVMHAPVSYLQQIPPIINQSRPPIHNQHRSNMASHYESPLIQHPMMPSPPTFVPGPVPSSQLPETRDRGMSGDAFADQIPPYALSQQYMQGPPPMMQQTQYPSPVYMQPNGGRYTPNATPPYVQTGMKQHYNAPPGLPNGRGSFREYRGNSGMPNASNGKWQHIGSNDIHGPRVIFRKDSIHSQEGYNHGAGVWARKLSNESRGRSSTASTSGGHQRFSNTHPQRHNTHVDPRQPEKWANATGTNTRTPASWGHLLSEFGCVNAHRPCNTNTKFDPCPCTKCKDRDRTIFVHRIGDGNLHSSGIMECLKQHFSKFGQVESATPADHHKNAVCVRFSNPQSAVAAVQTERRVQIEGLRDVIVNVNFRTGSQFFIPRDSAHGSGTHRRPTRNSPPEQQVAMSRPPNIGPSNFNAHSQPFQYHAPIPEGLGATSGAMIPTGDYSGAQLNVATQSGFGKREAERSPYAEPGLCSTLSLQAQQALASIDSKDTHGTASRQPIHGSPFLLGNQDMFKRLADATQEIAMSRQASTHGTPTKTPQSGNNAQQTGFSPIHAKDDRVQLPDSTEPTKRDVGTVIDYGTVHVRREMAQLAPIPLDWRQNLTPFSSTHDWPQPLQRASQSGQSSTAKIPDRISQPTPLTTNNSQQMQTTAGDISAESQPDSCENKVSSGDENLSEHINTISHAKRKISEDSSEEASSQFSSKKVPEVIQPDGPLPEPQGSQPIDDGQQALRQTGYGKKKGKNKNKNKNKDGPNQDAGLEVPENPSTTAPYETRTLQPDIAAFRLPQHPQELAQEVGSETAVLHVPEPGSVRMSPTNEKTTHGIEPFPAYRDAMSGPQLAIQGHQSDAIDFASTRSISSESTLSQGSSQKGHDFNPGAQNFVPVRPETTPTPASPVHGGKTDDNKDDNASAVVGKENNGPRTNSGTRQGNGKGKSKYGKGWKNGQKSGNGNNQTPTDRDTKANQQDKGKGKEVNVPETKLEAPTTTKGKGKNGNKTEVKGLKRPESGTGLVSAKKTSGTTTPSSTASSPSLSAAVAMTSSTKPKQGKWKSRNAHRKGVGNHPSAKADVRTDNATSSRGRVSPPEPTKPLLNSDDFPALPPSKSTSALTALQGVAAVPNLWQKPGWAASMLAPTPTAKSEGESREKGSPVPKGERKGG